MGWFTRILLSCAGLIAAWFVSRADEPRFAIMELVVILLLVIVAAVTTLYFPAIRGFVRSLQAKRDRADTPHR